MPQQTPDVLEGSEPSGNGRLGSWKEIACYLGRGLRTVQRWEREQGLPVHRLGHDRRGTVFAYKHELDAWWESQRIDKVDQIEASGSLPETTSPVRRPQLALVSSSFLICAAVAVWVLYTGRTLQREYTPVPLTSYPGNEGSPTFSPDGNHVAFTWNRNQRVGGNRIFVKLIGTDEPLRLTHGDANEFGPAWSPDGRFIAFLRSFSNGKCDVILIPAIGGAERKVAEVSPPDRAEAPFLSWHPDAKSLVIVDRETLEQPYAMFLLSIETGVKRRLTSPSRGSFADRSPAVSPDGRRLVFSRMVADGIGDLFLLELSRDLSPASQPRRLTFENRYTASPAWVPNGHAIIFSSGSPHSPNLYELALSRSGWHPGKPRRLTFAGQGVRAPAISRQGRLAYSVFSIDANIWRLELNGTGPAKAATKLIASTHLDHTAQYSPDGTHIAFASNRSGSHEIWVCNSDGSGTRQLTSFGGFDYAAGPRWAPDGRLILFEYRPEGRWEMFTVSSDGGIPRRVNTNFASVSPCGWSHDGNWIYFCSNHTEAFEIWKMLAKGGNAVRVTRTGGTGAVESPDGKFLYYLKNDKEFTSLWKVPVNGGEETQIVESVCCGNFAVLQQGIYFIGEPPAGGNSSVKFLSFASRKVTTIAELNGLSAYGLSVSPDGSWLLYSQYEQKGSDLMLVEDFR